MAEAGRARAARALLDGWAGLIRALEADGTSEVDAALETLATLDNGVGTLELTFPGGVPCLDGAVLAEGGEPLRVGAMLNNAGIKRVVVGQLEPSRLKTLSERLLKGGTTAAGAARGLAWGPLSTQRYDRRFAAAERHCVVAVEALRGLRARPTGDPLWRLVRVLRYLERVVEVSGMGGALGISSALAMQGGLDQRIAAACLRADISVRRVDGHPAIRRATMLATLLMLRAGLGQIGGRSLQDAAALAREATLAMAGGEALAFKAARSMLDKVARPGMTEPTPAALVGLLYRLERSRRSREDDEPLSDEDLLDVVAPGSPAEEAWVQVQTHLMGAAPAGTRVRVPDGRVGVLLGRDPSGGLTLLLGDAILTPNEARLRLAPAAGCGGPA